MARILFVDKNDYKDKLGIYYLTAVLKEAGHRVDYCEVSRDNIKKYFKKEVDFVFYSIMSSEYQWFKKYNRQLKRSFNFKTVVGGIHFTICPESGVNDRDVDFVVQGPGEIAALDIVNGKTTGKLVKGTIPDINSLPRPDRSIVYKYKEFSNASLKRFIASRDCPYNCSYCHNHVVHKLMHKQKDKFNQRLIPDKLIDDVIDVRDKYGIRMAVFNDDDFALDAQWVEAFCRQWVKRKVGVPFACYLNAYTASDGLLKLLAKSGLSLASIGIETANKTIREKILTRPKVTNERIECVIRKCMELGVRVKTLNMIGLPIDNSLEEALETLIFNQKLTPTSSSCCILEPFPNTDIYGYCKSKGFLKKHASYVDVRDKTILQIKDAEKINRLCKWWIIFVAKKISIDWINLILEIPLTKDISKKMLALSNRYLGKLYESSL